MVCSCELIYHQNFSCILLCSFLSVKSHSVFTGGIFISYCSHLIDTCTCKTSVVRLNQWHKGFLHVVSKTLHKRKKYLTKLTPIRHPPKQTNKQTNKKSSTVQSPKRQILAQIKSLLLFQYPVGACVYCC